LKISRLDYCPLTYYSGVMATTTSSLKGIKDIFYETRVLMGRDYTLKRFAEEVLESEVDPVMLGYIEKGTRFPNEALVRRVAALRKQDAAVLLAVLTRDRMLHAFGRELQRVLQTPQALGDIGDAGLAVMISQAIAALPDDEGWVPVGAWRTKFRVLPRQRRRQAQASERLGLQVEALLLERGLIEIQGDQVRQRGRYFAAETPEQRHTLAMQYCALFLKGLLDALLLPPEETGTYIGNQYLDINPARLPEFQYRLAQVVEQLVREFATDASSHTRLLNVLLTSTLF
jgi:hypothetical protein